VARPQGSACDSGAFESRGFTLNITSGDDQRTFVTIPFITLTAVTVVPQASGEPVDGGWVVFAGPASGAGITPTLVTVTVASSSASTRLWANSLAGSYSVSAGGHGLSAVIFHLANDPADLAIYQEVSGLGTYSFGATGVAMTVTNTGGCLQGLAVAQFNSNHPHATAPLQTGRYWTLLGYGSSSGFSLDLLLPTLFTPDATSKVCRYVPGGPGLEWDCVLSGFDPLAFTIRRNGLTAFSDWAAGDHVGATAVRLRSFSAIPKLAWMELFVQHFYKMLNNLRHSQRAGR
jgi:hypothetical protein